jgi:5-oxoprolinase (ATP-hydrolysing) subunit A
MNTTDINCDLGEGFKNDAELMPYISSANIACGAHAGDIHTMQKTVELCIQNNVAIGAHPGFNDKANFGRTIQTLSDGALYDLVAEQIVLLKNICAEQGAVLHHVKPHGALYNMAATDEFMSYIIATVIKELDPSLYLYGLSNSYLISEAKKIGLNTASEAFADRRYLTDGTLMPRSNFSALIHFTDEALDQCLQIIENKTVLVYNGFFNQAIPIQADTICIHGDGEHAVDFAKAINHCFTKNNIHLKKPGE